MKDREAARLAVRVWLNTELHEYADGKWDRGDRMHEEWDEEIHDKWDQFLLNYISRARTLHGTPGGFQAALKAMTTAFEMCVTMLVAGEAIPTPGVASGEIK